MLLGQLPIVYSLLSFTAALALHPRSSNPETIHEFPKPSWVENIAVRQNGQILVDLASAPEMYLLDPHANSAATLIHSFSSYFSLLGITETNPNIFHCIASNFSLSDPTNIANGTYSIQTVDLTSYNHKANTGAKIYEVVLIPGSGLLNGLSTLSASKGLIIASDSAKGYIWLINIHTGKYSILLQGPELEKPPESQSLGINGLRVLPHGHDTIWIFFSNQAKSTFNRVPISLSTLTPTGPIEKLTTNLEIDDFALDAENGYAYVAAGHLDQIFRVPLDGGNLESVLGGLNSSVIPNPTSVAFARGDQERNGEGRIFVTTAGGLEAPVNGSYVEGGKVVGFYLGR